MTKFAIGGIQMHLGTQDNLPEMKKRLAVMMHLYPWVEMVLFSELCHSGPNPQSAQATGGAYEQDCQELAAKYGIWLIPGSYYEARDGNLYNTTPVIDPQGQIILRYRKIFPFTPYEDSTTPGTEIGLFEVPHVGKFGVSICYDLWFPELTRAMVSEGAEVILNPVMA
ncbi:MAG: carbon-nitrogen hydrolase family protein, partial [Parahaliea sp.]